MESTMTAYARLVAATIAATFLTLVLATSAAAAEPWVPSDTGDADRDPACGVEYDCVPTAGCDGEWYPECGIPYDVYFRDALDALGCTSVDPCVRAHPCDDGCTVDDWGPPRLLSEACAEEWSNACDAWFPQDNHGPAVEDDDELEPTVSPTELETLEEVVVAIAPGGEVVPAPAPDTLPVTGIGDGLALAGLGTAALAGGAGLLRRSRR